METLELRNLNNTYFKVNTDERYEVFYDELNNNLIVFTPIDDDTNTKSICNSIGNPAYNYLIDLLNNTEHVVVDWSQISGTTSDYTIYYDMFPEWLRTNSYEQIMKEISKITTDEHIGMKYQVFRHGRMQPIKFN